MPIRGGRAYRQHTSFKRAILERDNHVCWVCGGRATEVDHVVPYKVCQETRPDNCRAVCTKCNRAARTFPNGRGWRTPGPSVQAVNALQPGQVIEVDHHDLKCNGGGSCSLTGMLTQRYRQGRGWTIYIHHTAPHVATVGRLR